MEILDLYDDFGNKLNQTIYRGEETENGKKHNVVSCLYKKQ